MSNNQRSPRNFRLKALILSGLVCPGLGQLTLGRKKRGVFFILSAIISLVIVAEKIYIITTGVITPDFMTTFSPDGLLAAYSQIRSEIYSQTALYIALFLGIWLIGLLDIIFGKNKPQK